MSVKDISQMTAAQLDPELGKGYADYQAGRTIPAGQVFAEIRKEYGVWAMKFSFSTYQTVGPGVTKYIF